MTKSKTKRLIVIAMILVILIGVGGFIMAQFHRCENIFDEMYYAIKEFPTVHSTNARYANCSDYFDDMSDKKILETSEDFFLFIYNSASMQERENYFAYAHVFKKEPQIEYAGVIDYYTGSDPIMVDALVVSYSYNVVTKELTLEPLAVIGYENLEAGYDYQTDDSVVVNSFIEQNNITREEIEEYQQYFLNEVFFRTWVEGNGADSKFTETFPFSWTANSLKKWNES